MLENEVINAYFKKTKAFFDLACKTIVGDSQNNIRNLENGIIGALIIQKIQ